MKKKLNILNTDADVSNPEQAMKIQLEMLQMRAASALTSLSKGHQRDFLHNVKNLKEIMTRINNLSYLSEPFDDKRLVQSLKESSEGSSSSISSDTKDGLIEIDGVFNILKLSRRIFW